MVGTGVLTESDLASAINWQALGVLLGMFIIASSLREAGFFEWVGLHLARSVDAHPVRMYVLLPLMTAGLASLLDIVTVALFIVPLTVEVFEGPGATKGQPRISSPSCQFSRGSYFSRGLSCSCNPSSRFPDTRL